MKRSLALVLFTGLILGSFLASDPYLHIYDEGFHALIAKNLSYDFFKPVLYRIPHLPYDIEHWWSNHIWLSKPILPFWLMNIAIQLFGENVYSLRFFSILFHLLSVLTTFFIGRRLFNQDIGLLAAFLHASHFLLLSVAAGKVSSDHCEAPFVFFSEIAIYLSLLDQKNKSLYIGVLLGLAFLSKWIAAIIPFVVVVVIYWIRYREKSLSKSVLLTLAFIFTFAPWLLYLSIQYPEEFTILISDWLGLLSSDSNQPHLHSWTFYPLKFGRVYGYFAYLALLWLIIKWKHEPQSKLILSSWIVIPIILLSLSPAKRETYLLVIAPAVFIVIAAAYYYFLEISTEFSSPKRNLINLLASTLILFPIYQTYHKISSSYNIPSDRRQTMGLDKIENINDFDPDKTIVFREDYPIEFMYFNDMMAYYNDPSNNQLKDLEEKGVKAVVRVGSCLEFIYPQND